MSAKSNKRRISRLFFDRFQGKVVWRSTEEQAWADMVPVGREFGSPDCERLSILDMYSFGDITEEDAMHQLGVDRSGLAQMLKRDGLSPLLVPDTLPTKAGAGTDSQNRVGDAKDLKGMFGKTAKTVSVDDMNPCKGEP